MNNYYQIIDIYAIAAGCFRLLTHSLCENRKYRGAKDRLDCANILPFAIVMSRNNRKWHPLPFSLIDLCGDDVVVPTIKIKRPQRHSGRLCDREISTKLRTPIVTSDGSFISFNALTAFMASHGRMNIFERAMCFESFYDEKWLPEHTVSVLPEFSSILAIYVS